MSMLTKLEFKGTIDMNGTLNPSDNKEVPQRIRFGFLLDHMSKLRKVSKHYITQRDKTEKVIKQ